MSAECRSCKRRLIDGETVFADDWKVLDVSGTRAAWRTEVRYTCETCAAVAK